MSETEWNYPPLSTFANFEVLLVEDREDWVQDVSDRGFPDPHWPDGKDGQNSALFDNCEDAYKHATSVEPPEGYRIAFVGNQIQGIPMECGWLFSWEDFEKFMEMKE
tara:strand:- start:1696 stop:2016 length:321 start_codon:yes stop_codon:yes gene_type:complete